MSILVVRVVPQGIIMAADRNVTIGEITPCAPNYVELIQGQMECKKIIRWPNNRAIIGSVGEARIAGKSIYDWLYDFMGENINFESLEILANKLKEKIQQQPDVEEWFENKKASIIHLVGFENTKGKQLPFVWFIRNVAGMKDGNYTGHTKEMICSEEFWKYHSDKRPEDLRNHFKKEDVPFTWFHQGYDLQTFNTLALNVEQVIRYIDQMIKKKSEKKNKLEDWYPYVAMMINTYSSYFKSFYPPYKQYVGGGVDVEGIEWPPDEIDK